MRLRREGSVRRRVSEPARVRRVPHGVAAAILAAGIFAAGILISGCGDAGEERIPLRVAYTKNLTMSPLLIAEAEGFFEEEGLDVELMAIEAAATGIPALLQGRIDVLPGPMSPSLFNAILRGGRLRLVADKGSYSSSQCAHQAFVVSPAAIERGEPVDLRRVGTAKEPFLQFFVERALRERGYDPDAIELFHIPQAAEFEALVAGRLDAAMVGEPWLTRVRERGGVIWTPTNELLDGFQYSVIAFGPSLLDHDPEAGRRFAVAMLRAVRRYNEGKTPRNLEIIHETLGYDREVLGKMCLPPMRNDGRIDDESILEFQRWAVERGDLDGLVQPEEFWDPSFVEHAVRVLDERAAR